MNVHADQQDHSNYSTGEWPYQIEARRGDTAYLERTYISGESHFEVPHIDDFQEPEAFGWREFTISPETESEEAVVALSALCRFQSNHLEITQEFSREGAHELAKVFAGGLQLNAVKSDPDRENGPLFNRSWYQRHYDGTYYHGWRPRYHTRLNLELAWLGLVTSNVDATIDTPDTLIPRIEQAELARTSGYWLVSEVGGPTYKIGYNSSKGSPPYADSPDIPILHATGDVSTASIDSTTDIDTSDWDTKLSIEKGEFMIMSVSEPSENDGDSQQIEVAYEFTEEAQAEVALVLASLVAADGSNQLAADLRRKHDPQSVLEARHPYSYITALMHGERPA